MKTNLEVLREIREKRKLSNEIEKRKIKSTEYIFRHNTFITSYLRVRFGNEKKGLTKKKVFGGH